MATLDKAESSRINGAKSHGPVTPEGKQHSSLNALRHGILATFICLTSEEKDKFKELVQDFLTRLQPLDNVELRIVEQLATCAFRLERFVTTEAALFDLEMDAQAEEVAKMRIKDLNPADRFAMAFKSLADKSKSLQLYLRYETTITRQYDRALKQLLTLRAKFPIPAEETTNDERTTTNEGRTTTNDKRPDSVLPNEPTDPLTCCGFNTDGVCAQGRTCPDAHLYKPIA